MGPGTREAHVEVEGGLGLAGDLIGCGAEFGGGSGVGEGGVGGGELGHHDAPRGIPGCADGGDEEAGREGGAPQELGGGGEEGSWVRRLVAGHFSANVAGDGFGFGQFGGAGFLQRR